MYVAGSKEPYHEQIIKVSLQSLAQEQGADNGETDALNLSCLCSIPHWEGRPVRAQLQLRPPGAEAAPIRQVHLYAAQVGRAASAGGRHAPAAGGGPGPEARLPQWRGGFCQLACAARAAPTSYCSRTETSNCSARLAFILHIQHFLQNQQMERFLSLSQPQLRVDMSLQLLSCGVLLLGAPDYEVACIGVLILVKAQACDWHGSENDKYYRSTVTVYREH